MRLFMNLTKDEWDRLSALAQAERRPLREQAALLVADGLKRQTKRVSRRTQAQMRTGDSSAA